MNNGDKIRSMSNEELTLFLMCPGEYDLNFNNECNGEMNRNCIECTRKWLETEYEKEE